MVSAPLLNMVTKSKIIPAILTDHDLVQINIKIPENFVRGPGYWKFNSSYLHNIDYVNLIKETIRKAIKDNMKLEDKGLLWDIVKMKIRADSIKFASDYRRKQKCMESELQKNFK